MATERQHREPWELAFWTVLVMTHLFWGVVGYAIAVLVLGKGG